MSYSMSLYWDILIINLFYFFFCSFILDIICSLSLVGALWLVPTLQILVESIALLILLHLLKEYLPHCCTNGLIGWRFSVIEYVIILGLTFSLLTFYFFFLASY